MKPFPSRRTESADPQRNNNNGGKRRKGDMLHDLQQFDSLQDGGPNAAKAVLLEKPKAPID